MLGSLHGSGRLFRKETISINNNHYYYYFVLLGQALSKLYAWVIGSNCISLKNGRHYYFAEPKMLRNTLALDLTLKENFVTNFFNIVAFVFWRAENRVLAEWNNLTDWCKNFSQISTCGWISFWKHLSLLSRDFRS